MTSRSPTPQAIIRFAAWVALLGIVAATIGPLSMRPTSDLSPDLERFFAYALVGALFILSYPNRLLLVCAFLIAVAAGLELAQMIVPHRDAHLVDFAWKSGGALLGALFAFAGQQLLSRRR
jgi:VanZ family protein